MSDPCIGVVGSLVGQEAPLATVATVATVRLQTRESVATVAAVATQSVGTSGACNRPNAGPKVVLAKAIREAEDCQAYFEERAAIREYDGGLPRDEAERLAVEDTLTHYFGPNLAAKGTK